MSQITATLSFGLEVELSNGHHTWRADEPVPVGGADTGPNLPAYVCPCLP